MYTTIFKKMKLFFSLPVDLIGDGFDVFGHMVDEFPARFSVKDDVGSPSGDEFVAMVIVVFVKNTGVKIWVLVEIINE